MRPDPPAFFPAALSALAGALLGLAGMTRCHGAERVFRVAWNPSEGATSYEVFRGTERIAVTTGTTAEVRTGHGSATLAVRALNAAGASPFSAPLVIAPVWTEIRQTIEFSADLKTWSDRFTPDSRFARIRNETKEP